MGNTSSTGHRRKWKKKMQSLIKGSRTVCPPLSVMNVVTNDHLLEEILIRMPAKSANRFKCVSKRWNSLISHPYFVCHFIHQHQTSKNFSDEDDDHLPPFMLLFQDPPGTEYRYLSTSDSKMFESRGFSLSFLPCYQPQDGLQFMIHGAFNDLILCSSIDDDVYFICNPITMQFLELPPAPQLGKDLDLFQVGLICDPIREQVEQGCSVINTASYRYAVIHIPEFKSGSTTFKLEVFTSQTNEWTESYVPCPQGFRYRLIDPVVCNRIMYWLFGEYLFGYDAFATHKENRYRFIGLPPGFQLDACNMCLGVCQGRLRLSQMLPCHYPYEYDDGPNHEPTLFIWELKGNDGDNNNNWCLKHEIFLNGLSSETLNLVQFVASDDSSSATVLGFHPHDPDIVYLRLRDRIIVLCNIRFKTLKMVCYCQFPNKPCFHSIREVVTLVLPSWPTPVPRLPSQSR